MAAAAALQLCLDAAHAADRYIVFQSGFERPDGSIEPFSDDTGRHVISGLSSRSHVSAGEKKFGKASLWSSGHNWGFTWFYTSGANTSRATVAPSPDWDLSLSAGDAFTVEYWYYQDDATSVYDALTNANGFAATGWTARHNGPGMQFAWFDATGQHHTVDALFVGWMPRRWHHVAWEKNSAGKLRLYLDGAIKISASLGVVRASPEPLRINLVRNGSAYMDGLRITKGFANYDQDGGFAVR